jgi:hypothetical protein
MRSFRSCKKQVVVSQLVQRDDTHQYEGEGGGAVTSICSLLKFGNVRNAMFAVKIFRISNVRNSMFIVKILVISNVQNPMLDVKIFSL